MGEVDGLPAQEAKRYRQCIADRRLMQRGLPAVYRMGSNPLPWLEGILNGVEHVNFFENRATEYSHPSTCGTSEEAFD